MLKILMEVFRLGVVLLLSFDILSGEYTIDKLALLFILINI